MRPLLAALCLPLLLVGTNALALPPKVEADKLQLEIRADIDAKHCADALAKFQRLSQLAVPLPDTIHYHWGSAALCAGNADEGLKHLDIYLTREGSNAKFYKEALDLYTQAEKQRAKEEGKLAKARADLIGYKKNLTEYRAQLAELQSRFDALTAERDGAFLEQLHKLPASYSSKNRVMDFRYIFKLERKDTAETSVFSAYYHNEHPNAGYTEFSSADLTVRNMLIDYAEEVVIFKAINCNCVTYAGPSGSWENCSGFIMPDDDQKPIFRSLGKLSNEYSKKLAPVESEINKFQSWISTNNQLKDELLRRYPQL